MQVGSSVFKEEIKNEKKKRVSVSLQSLISNYDQNVAVAGIIIIVSPSCH